MKYEQPTLLVASAAAESITAHQGGPGDKGTASCFDGNPKVVSSAGAYEIDE